LSSRRFERLAKFDQRMNNVNLYEQAKVNSLTLKEVNEIAEPIS